ncbi:M23 family metallopeptidase [Pedobacter sp. SD-b]|uniref:M23 family metallopeptidase n=1 Tax=Pedobacter segetis TaxID=2793069 RepID=A0ABS1BL38_9SPHI|nr:M23 family metallopeptidase [Pedobacter segetis]MBK0383566.1 M23 family metallopeptidase [Pedobacter segetis]
MKTLKFLTLCFLCTICKIATAQENLIKFTTTRNLDKSIDFNFDKADPGTFTILLTFKNLENATPVGSEIVISGYSGKFYTLKPDNANQDISFSFSCTYVRGKTDCEIQSDFLYLLPYKNGTKVKMNEAINLEAKYFGNTKPDDWKSYFFLTEKEDTVTAIRRGLVVEIKNDFENQESNVVFTSNTNSIIVEHADGTFARYGHLKKGSILVKVGQTVYPANSLGLNTKGNSSYKSSLTIMYLVSNDLQTVKTQNLKTYKSVYGYVTPQFATQDHNNLVLKPNEVYTAFSTPDMIRKEMNKKELKVFK